MAQLLQSNLPATSIGASEILVAIPAASNRQFPVRTGALAMKKLEAELNEHRYYLEQKVEQRTEQLMKRISLLESCNATLCDKLAQAKKDIAILHKQSAVNRSDSGANVSSGQLSGIGEEREIRQKQVKGWMGWFRRN